MRVLEALQTGENSPKVTAAKAALGQAQAAARPTMLALNHAASGQAVAMVQAGAAALT